MDSFSLGRVSSSSIWALWRCFTVVFTPVGTAIGIVLNSIVHKSEHENTSAEGEGIKFAAAKAAGFAQTDDGVEESPAI